jgi:hypothetical protein
MYVDVTEDMEALEIEGVQIPIAGKQTLIRSKNTIRPSEAADRRFLQALVDAEANQG